MAGCLIGTRPLTLHDFHASVTQIQYNAKERVFEISIRVFTDDFEKALSAATNSKISLTNSPGPANDKNDSIIEKYVQSHFAYVTPQKQAKPFKYIGHETEVDANWIYLEIPYTEPFQGGLLKQSMLTELFDDQVNMVNVQYQGQKKTFVFRKSQPIQDISLSK